MKCPTWLPRLSRCLSVQLTTAARRILPAAMRHLRKNPHGHNTLGSIVVSCALGFLYFQTQPTTAGTDPSTADSAALIADAEKSFGDLAPTTEGDVKGADGRSATTIAVNETPTLTGHEALRESDRILAITETMLQKIPAYSATFLKQERIGDSLSEIQVIQLRMIHHPMKISMRWEGGLDAGQRVVFAEGENDGNMLVRKQKGFEARLGVITLNPHGALAMKYSRYPVTEVGLLRFTKLIREQRAKDLLLESGVSAKMLERQQIDGREAVCFAIEYDSPKWAPDANQEYRKTQIYIDTQTKLPICVRCFGWPEKIRGADPDKLDQTTLLELYAYKNIDLEAQVQHEDFTRAKLQ